jgi:protein-S-isoprenylcysteine O-methyltransferase Ste14
MATTIYLSGILLFFILAFFVKNIKTYLKTGLSIKNKSKKVNLSILLSSLIYILILCRLFFMPATWWFEFSFFNFGWLSGFGYVLISLGFLMGLLALQAMKESWRIGIPQNHKTELITYGIYSFSRNPYFFSYNLLILGFILIFPSLILMSLFIVLVIIFHKMILEEEMHLEKLHGENYLEYKSRVSRYFKL